MQCYSWKCKINCNFLKISSISVFRARFRRTTAPYLHCWVLTNSIRLTWALEMMMVLITWGVILASSYLPATSGTPGTAEVAAERKLQSTLSWHRHTCSTNCHGNHRTDKDSSFSSFSFSAALEDLSVRWPCSSVCHFSFRDLTLCCYSTYAHTCPLRRSCSRSSIFFTARRYA